MDYPFCIRVQFQGQLKCIELDWAGITSENFINAVVIAFGIVFDPDLEPRLVLTDNLGMEIPRKQFEHIAKTFHRGSSHFVNVAIQSANISNAIAMVTPMMLENYFIQSNRGALLLHKTSNCVTDQIRRTIVNCCVDFMVEAFGLENITTTRKKMTASSTIILFPFLRYKDSKTDGTDLLVGNGGVFCNRLKYLQKQKRSAQTDIHENLDEQQDLSNSIVMRNAKENFEFLKSAIIDQTDLEILKQKLNSTRSFRANMLQDKNIDLRENFPFFFSHPSLILLDFELMFNSVDTNAMKNTWPEFSSRLRERFSNQEKYAVVTCWSQGVEDFLLLLKMFPSKPKGRPLTFPNLMDKFVVFSLTTTPPEKMIRQSNSFPYIIATGFSPKEILRYYIEVERHLITLPRDFEFFEVFDAFFKIHKLLNMDFNEYLRNMMNFLQTFLYQLNDGQAKPSAHMKDIFNQLKA